MKRCKWVLASFAAALLLLEGEARTDDTHSPVPKYQWKIGTWGSCFAPGGCGEGRRERQVRCSDPDGRTALEFLCDSLPKPIKMKSCFTACRHHKDKLQWQVGSWGPCVPVSPTGLGTHSTNMADKENVGVTQRNVTCVLVSHDAIKVHKTVDEDNCFTVARKPDPVRFCHIPHPQDCIVSQFSEWSSCSDCNSGDNDVKNSTRYRIVLVAPMNGGKPCPQLTESKPCPHTLECLTNKDEISVKFEEYKLKVGEWRQCEPPATVVSAEEIESKDIDEALLQHSLSSVSPNFNSAAATNSVTSESTSSYVFRPQVGYQTREVSCRDSKGTIIDLSLCVGENGAVTLPPKVQPCIISEDCIVTHWSPWMRVQDGCVAMNGKVRAEIHERKREVIKLSAGNGQPCPHLIETRQITSKEQLQLCSQKYHWHTSKWSPCVVTFDDSSGPKLTEVGCGGGIQLREVTCVATETNQPVLREMCESLEPVPTVQRCEVACPRDCEVGPWEPWSPCKPQDCSNHESSSKKGYRERKRKIVVMSSENGVDCPSTTEIQPCTQPSCYIWDIGPWSSCYLDTSNKHCGEGRRTRSVTCKSVLYENIVDDSLCSKKALKPAEEEPCLLPCPYDCVLSPWSEWSPCSHSCTSNTQIALRQRNRTIIAPPGPGGHNCPNLSDMLQIEPCNTHSCFGYSWLTLPWQQCQLIESHNIEKYESDITADFYFGSENVKQHSRFQRQDDSSVYSDTLPTCGSGRQDREVWCVEANEKKVDDEKCDPLPKPITSRSCSRTCPTDCETSPWSDWSPCPQQCVPDSSTEIKDGEVTPTQSRHRVIIQSPLNGGAPCPNLEEVRPCPLSGARCKHYLWGVGSWSDCQLPATAECGMGFRTRAVWCYRNHQNTKVEASLCIENNGSSPHQSEECYVDCQFPCTLSEWSEWSACKHACGTKTRTRQLIGSSANRNVCKNPEIFPLVETESCPCDEYTSQPIGDWSDCILDRDIITVSANGRSAQGLCGSGTRFRRNGCFNNEGNLVEPSLCGKDTGLEEEPCLVPCPSDCIVSDWSSWGECSSTCGPGLQNRTRQIIRTSQNLGRPCEETIQHKICNKPCENFKWFSGGWSECQLSGTDQAVGCGTGEQYRQVRCMETVTPELSKEVADTFCDPLTQPADMNVCYISCPGDCVLSPWSDWSECTQPCNLTRERQRTRSILRAPASEAEVCPPLIEVQSCQVNATCFSYSWHTTNYSSCLPLGGSPCGEGIQSRAVYCIRSDKRPVPDSYCQNQVKPAPSEKWCYVDCPVDCEVTQWSNWNSSECQCGNTGSMMVRYRYITTNPSERGRPCPLPLIQHKPCPAIPCYSWDIGDWSTCTLREIIVSEGSWCGHGVISRNLTCLRGEKIAVEDNLCEESSSLDLRPYDSCYIPCRGDCQVSEWSPWSHCHRNCQGPDIGGYQTRSRAILRPPINGGEPCPTALWETRPCFSGPCLTFDWNIMENGQTVCKRSDGVTVIGGCDSKPKPCPLSCDVIPHGVCDTRTGQCVCAWGYKPLNEEPPLVCIATEHVTTVTDRMMHQRAFEDAPTETTSSFDEIQSRFYYPKDDEINIWMFAVIGIGCMFIVFVIVSIYLMCNSSMNGQRGTEVQMLTMQSSKP